MELIVVVLSLVGAGHALPVPRLLGLSASNSNELLRLPGLSYNGLAFGQQQQQQQPLPFVPPFVFQPQQIDMALPPQLSRTPQIGVSGQGSVQPTGSLPSQVLLPPQVFVPSQSGVPPQVLLPAAQGDQTAISVPQQPLYPQEPGVPLQPNQVLPSYYPSFVFPQQAGGQVSPFFIAYGYPSQKQPAVQQLPLNPNQQPMEPAVLRPQQFMQDKMLTIGGTAKPSALEGVRAVPDETLPSFLLPFQP
ncbi:annexin A7 [Erpetoichthys calabaricus]|uniref:annexin A7 n=1 Tax=Erpetoichthys calabaricus TaxID=27687 RepID=UPI00109F47B0|nr:annexin A7 [Erpetoichthys calabaricus]